MPSLTDKEMILKFLRLAYPISRVKHLDKFRRAIILDNRVYLLNDTWSVKMVKSSLSMLICKLFVVDEPTALAVLDNFLNIKK